MAAAPTRPGSLRIGVLQPIDGDLLAPDASLDLSSWLVMTQIFERPYRYTAQGALLPLLFVDAQKRTGSQLVARVRPNAKFSDGSPVTAADVARSLGRARLFARVSAVVAEGDRVILTPHIDVDLPRELSKPWASIARPHGRGFIGNGAFCLAPDQRAGELRLVRNPHYDGAPAACEEIRFIGFAQRGGAPALCEALRQGEVHLTTVLDRSTVEGLDGVRKLFAPGASTAVLWANCERIPDVATRRALLGAIDRYALAKCSYDNALAFVARSLLPPRMGQARDTIKFDPAQAQQILARSPLASRPLRMLRVWGPRAYLPDPDRWAKVIVDQLAAVGVKVEVVSTRDIADYQARLGAADYDLVLGGWNADTEDSADFLEAFLHSSMVPKRGETRTVGCNFSRWAQPQTDAVLAKVRATGSTAAQQQAIEIVDEQGLLLALAHGPSVVVHRWNVQGFAADTLGQPDLAKVTVRD
jgi:ABC-type transport system substrate-binding protein